MTGDIAMPIIVVRGEDCLFYRELSGLRADPDATVFDGLGRRLRFDGGAWRPTPGGDDADELAGVLRAWLGRMDALRESTATWSLELLIRASVDHLGFS